MTGSRTTQDVALVLSSGGARGLAHIGAIEELESHGYHISSVAGCSMGVLIGGVYAAGKMNEFRERMKTIVRKKMIPPFEKLIQNLKVFFKDRTLTIEERRKYYLE